MDDAEAQEPLPRSDLQIAAHAARRYYLDDRSKVDIAAELGVSRFKVARLLDLARTEGIVTIKVHDPRGVDPELSESLRAALGIRQALVLDAAPQRRTQVGALDTAPQPRTPSAQIMHVGIEMFEEELLGDNAAVAIEQARAHRVGFSETAEFTHTARAMQEQVGRMPETGPALGSISRKKTSIPLDFGADEGI